MRSHSCIQPLYPLQDHLSYTRVSPSHIFFLLIVSSSFKPQHYNQAIKFPHWRDVMAAELEAMQQNRTWSIVPLPRDKHSIGCR